MSVKILIPVSVGELFDKFTILSIKLIKITDPTKKKILKTEFNLLEDRIEELVTGTIDKVIFYKRLIDVNVKIWDIENEIRELEAKKDFGVRFIELARQVYKTNDERSKIKADVNKFYGSEISEVKQYSKY